MKAVKLIPMLWTNQLSETIDFYTTVLGFFCANRSDEWGWASLSLGEIELMLAKPNEHLPFEKPMFTGSLYFQVENVDEIYGNLKKKVKLLYPIEDFDWGMREFAIYDNNGYILQFGEEIRKPL